MKGFKRSKEETATPVPVAPAAQHSGQPAWRELLPGIGAAVVGLLAAVVVLWFGLINDNRQQQLEQLSKAWGGTQAAVIQQALTQLSRDTQLAARNPQLLEALQSGDPARVQAAERSLATGTGWSMPTSISPGRPCRTPSAPHR